MHTDSNGDLWSHGEVLGLDFVYRAEEDSGTFLLRDSTTGEWLNTLAQERLARQPADSAWQQAEERSEQAEARIRELEAEIERLRDQQT